MDNLETIESSIQFPNLTVGEASTHASELSEFLKRTVPTIKTKSVSSDRDSQSAADILNIVLNSASIIAIAGGIAAYLKKRPHVTLTIKPGGSMTVEGINLSSNDSVEIIKNALEKV